MLKNFTSGWMFSMYPPLKLSIPIISTSDLFSIIQSASLDPKRPATHVINTLIFYTFLFIIVIPLDDGLSINIRKLCKFIKFHSGLCCNSSTSLEGPSNG